MIQARRLIDHINNLVEGIYDETDYHKLQICELTDTTESLLKVLRRLKP